MLGRPLFSHFLDSHFPTIGHVCSVVNRSAGNLGWSSISLLVSLKPKILSSVFMSTVKLQREQRVENFLSLPGFSRFCRFLSPPADGLKFNCNLTFVQKFIP